MKGTEAVYIVALVFTFIIGISAFVLLYARLSTQMESNDFETLKSTLALPEETIDKLINSKRLTASFSLVNVINESQAKGFVVRNTGDAPLTGFTLKAGDVYIKPFIAPDILFPDSLGAILVSESAWKTLLDAKSVQILTNQKASVVIGLGA